MNECPDEYCADDCDYDPYLDDDEDEWCDYHDCLLDDCYFELHEDD